MRAALILLVALLAGEAPALEGDVVTNDPSGERVSAALVSVAMRRETVRRTTEYCGNTYPAMKIDSAAAFVAWTNRQSGFLTVATSIRDKITQDTASVPQKAA